MGVGEDFSLFCANLTVNNREFISTRYRLITKRLNADFWGSDSYTENSFYTGSYGRGTAIGGFSDLDMIFVLPNGFYRRYDIYNGNGQSALLQEVRKSILRTYPSTQIGGDGQVVVVTFGDRMYFEVVPAFLNNQGTYTFPDSNGGGRWRTTNPKPEIAAIRDLDLDCNSNLKRLCRMTRAWKIVWEVPMGGLLIDTLASTFLRTWEFRGQSYLYYDFMVRDFFEFLANQNPNQDYWYAYGSNQQVNRKGLFEYKAKRCYNIACAATQYGLDYKQYSARRQWREIYGTAYPG